MQMENEFDTYVGERGTLPFGGQKQRISIARIFKNPPILGSWWGYTALDKASYGQHIQKAFEELAEDERLWWLLQ